MKKNYSKEDNIEFNEEFELAFKFMDESNNNTFITGKAGTGKSTLLEYFRDNTSKNIVVLAPTGVSALNVKGQTIHSFFRFKPDITVEGVKKIRMRKSQKAIYENLDAIVIDEISMVRADLLDCINAFLCLHGKYKDMPFGGIQMIFFGDLFQLPPVVTNHEKKIFTEQYKSPYFFDASSYKYLKIKHIELKKVYRQTDEVFIDLLNHIRVKSVNYDHICLLNKRVNPNFKPEGDDLYVYLTTTNSMADKINEERLASLKTRLYHFEGEIIGDFEKKTLPTYLSLDLKFGAQVMLLNNDPQGKWINGSIGKIISVKSNGDSSDVVNVELGNARIVEVNPFTWEMFRFNFNEETQKIESESIGSFTQYPIKLAWAITIHKSQGKTFSKVIVDIGHGTFAAGQAYVALSRCTSFDGLVLKRPIYKNHILLDQNVIDFINNIQNNN